MTCYLQSKDNLTVSIPKVKEIDKVTYYVILVQIGDVSWWLEHRYSDFVSLHDKLVTDHCVTKDILPPKKVIGKRDPAFVEKRRLGLHSYLVAIVSFLKETMPRVLAIFLDFQKYDILFLLQEMASSFLTDGDALLTKSKTYIFNPLQMHSISERLKQPCPPVEIFDRCYDFSHVLDFCHQLVRTEVVGSWDKVGSSNIIPNKCAFEFSMFKELQELILRKVSIDRIYHTGSLRHTLKKLSVLQCGLQSLADILLCDAVHKDCSTGDLSQEKIWLQLLEVDVSQNLLNNFDSTLLLMPNLKKLTANENQITQVDNFTHLSNLSHLSLSANRISNIENLHLHLSNIVHLNLSQNLISSLIGFSTLHTLQELDLGSNIIEDVSELEHIQTLKKLDYLVLTGNPVATVVDYRIKVLEHFGRRAANICLDNERPSQSELDTVAVVLALRLVQEGKAPVFSQTIEPTYPNSPLQY